MQPIDTTLLHSFATLARTGSFSRTAQIVGRSQSAVSAQIKKLEEQVGVRLVARDRRNVALTSDGESLLAYAQQILRLSEAMVAHFRDPGLAGEVRFGSPEDFATHFLPGLLAAFSEAHPQVFLSVTCDLTLRLVNHLATGYLDLAIIKQNPDNPYPGAQPLWREPLAWVGAPSLDRQLGLTEAAAALPHGDQFIPLALSPQPCVYRQRCLDALGAQGRRWMVTYESPSFAGVTAAVRAGLGLTVMPRSLVPEGLMAFDAGEGWPGLMEAELCLLARPQTGPAVQALAEFIHKRVGSDRQNR